ncbi:MAG TPA: transglycosylase domain-containing protein [Candidatus Limnocylindria bacterium]|nr:transglycosylase domain-containing protein [Candidatus Limnocylindria bacterium]
MRRHQWPRFIVAIAAVPLLIAAGLRLAPLDAPETRWTVPGSVVLDARGVVLRHLGGDGLRIPVALSAVAPVMREATVSAEDRRFFQHIGVDPLAIARAALTRGTQPSGASTITQQIARRLYLADDRGPSLERKAREALVALQLEARRDKNEILALYLNDVYYGRGAYGIEAAARVYFGVSAANLDLAHASYLAGLPQRPSAYDPTNDPGPARQRQAYVLSRMVADGKVTRADADAAASQPIALLPQARAPIAEQFVEYALGELARIRPDLAGRDGLVIETTLDAGLQLEAERLARQQVRALRERNVTNAAVVAIEPRSGRIVAMVGGATDGSASHGGAINMAIAPRQPGSALKPFLYAAAFERGFTAATPLLDVPSAFASEEGPYAPLNFDRSFHGVVPLRVALGSSLNVPAVRTLDALGLDAMLEIAHRFGLTTLSAVESYGLSLTLGGGDVRLLDLTAAYAALGAGGELSEPFAVARVRDAAGRVLYQRAAATPRRVLSPEHAYLVADILSDAYARIPGFGGVTPFDLPFPAAVKSGTTTGFRDDWTLGYTPEIAVGVWTGNADGSPMAGVAGVDGAGPIWRDTMMAAALGQRMGWYARPAGLVERTVCDPTGLLPGVDCPTPVRELFVAGTEPTAVERYYARSADGRILIDPPAEARAWARDAGIDLVSGAVPAIDQEIRIVAPVSGSVFYIAPELASQELSIRAAAATGVQRITFEIDGRVVAEVPASDARLVWSLEPGSHTLRAIARHADGTTSEATVRFEVRR